MSSALDVAPDVELGPVADRERAQVLARGRRRALSDVPRLGPLVPRVPAARSGRGSDRIRSLARALSSSRRPPPNAASKPCSTRVSSSVTDCRRLRLARGPCSSTTRPSSIDVLHAGRRRARGPSARRACRGTSTTSGKLCPVSTCMHRERDRRRREGLGRRCAAAPPSPCRR